MEGQFHCVKCERKHNRSSMIGSFHHFELDHEEKDLEPEEVAVGVAFIKAQEDRRWPAATVEEIADQFDGLGFREQFPGVNVGDVVSDWFDSGLISDERHTGKHWFLFVANGWVPKNADRSPEVFHTQMKHFASEFERVRVR